MSPKKAAQRQDSQPSGTSQSFKSLHNFGPLDTRDRRGLGALLNTGWLALAVSILCLTCLSVFALYPNWAFYTDDSYIFYRYVENFANGWGFAFSQGEYVEGFSSPLWLMLLGMVKQVFDFATVPMTKVIGHFVAMMTMAWVLCRIASEWRDRLADKTASPFIALGFSLLIFAVPGYFLWAVSGMENPLVSLLLTIFVICLADARFRAAGYALALLGLTRPEALMFGALVIFAPGVAETLRSALLRPKSAFRSPAFCEIFDLIAIVVVVHFGALLFRLVYFGDFVPNTVRMKTPSTFSSTISEGWHYLKSFFRYHPAFCSVLIATALSFRLWWNRPVARIALGALVLQTVFSTLVGGDWMRQWRFFASFAPIAVLFIGASFAQVPLSRSRFVRTTLPLVVLLGSGVALAHGVQGFIDNVPDSRIEDGGPWKLGEFLKRHSPPSALLAVGDAGVIPYVSGLRVLDLHGLMEPYLARLEGSFSTNPHSKTDPDFVFSKHPTWVVLISGTPYTTRDKLSVMFDLYAALREYPVFKEHYEFAGEFYLTPRYIYHVFYDSRQLTRTQLEVQLEVDKPSKFELYNGDSLDRPFTADIPERALARPRLDNFGELPRLLRIDPTSDANAEIQLYGLVFKLDNKLCELSPPQVQAAISQGIIRLTGLQVLRIDDTSKALIMRTSNDDPQILLSVRPLIKSICKPLFRSHEG